MHIIGSCYKNYYRRMSSYNIWIMPSIRISIDTAGPVLHLLFNIDWLLWGAHLRVITESKSVLVDKNV